MHKYAVFAFWYCFQYHYPSPAGDLHPQLGQPIRGLELGDPQPRQHVTHPFGEQFHQRNPDRLDGAFVPAFGFQRRGMGESHLLGQRQQR